MAGQKKQIPLRVSPELYSELMAWADSEFRSVNGQIEYLLTQAVRQRKKAGNKSSAGSEASGPDYAVRSEGVSHD